MGAILEYARRRPMTWEEWWGVVIGIALRTGLVLMLLFVELVATAELLKDLKRVGPGSPVHYWRVYYSPMGSVVEREGDSIVYVWRGRDHHMYLRVSAAAAEAAGDAGAQAFVQRLIGYLSTEASEEYRASLRQLTGEDFGLDAGRWQAWATVHLTEVKGGEAVHRAWMDMESEAQARPGAGMRSYSFLDPVAVEARWQKIYLDEVQGYWSNSRHVARPKIPGGETLRR